jgi:hypothetical protein
VVVLVRFHPEFVGRLPVFEVAAGKVVTVDLTPYARDRNVPPVELTWEVSGAAGGNFTAVVAGDGHTLRIIPHGEGSGNITLTVRNRYNGSATCTTVVRVVGASSPGEVIGAELRLPLLVLGVLAAVAILYLGLRPSRRVPKATPARPAGGKGGGPRKGAPDEREGAGPQHGEPEERESDGPKNAAPEERESAGPRKGAPPDDGKGPGSGTG